MTKQLLQSLAFGLVASILMQLPLIGLLLALVAAPLMFVVPELGTTGAHVEIGFAWIGLKSALAWAAFVVYFSLLFGLMLALIQFVKTKRANKAQ